MTSRPLCAAFALTAAIVVSACASQDQPPAAATAEVPEIRPGILMGYLSPSEPLDSLAFVLPAPGPGSPRQQLDDAVSEYAMRLRGSARWELARVDAELRFPAAADTFACALDAPIGEQHTPALYMLLRRTLADAGLSTYPAKNAYQRQRPFMVNGEPTCTPQEEEHLSHDGSYPSGHTAIGWAWALILSQLAPERSDMILERGRAFGESRIVCNVHWYSDVLAGRMVGSAAVARLQANDGFRAAMDAAGAELWQVREQGLGASGDCAAERAALSARDS